MRQLREFIESTQRESYEDAMEFELDVIPSFCDAIGVDQDNLYFHPAIAEGKRTDAMVAAEPSKEPWAIVEAVYSDRRYILKTGEMKAKEIVDQAGAEYGILIGIGYLWVNSSHGTYSTNIRSATDSELSGIENVLTQSDPFPDETSDPVNKKKYNENKIEEPNFELDLGQFEQALEAVDKAQSAQEKGDSFEQFVDLLFGGVPFLEVRDRNLRTSTGEIDIVIEYALVKEIVGGAVSGDFVLR